MAGPQILTTYGRKADRMTRSLSLIGRSVRHWRRNEAVSLLLMIILLIVMMILLMMVLLVMGIGRWRSEHWRSRWTWVKERVKIWHFMSI